MKLFKGKKLSKDSERWASLPVSSKPGIKMVILGVIAGPVSRQLIPG